MTTKVTISINGSGKPCAVSVTGQPDSTVQPGTGIEVNIHGDVRIKVREAECGGGSTTQGGGGPGEPDHP